MYKNVGRKLKNMATGVIVRMSITYGILGAVAGGVFAAMIYLHDFIGPCSIFGMMLSALIGFLVGREKAALLYAYGEIAEGVMMLRHKVCGDIPPVNGYPIPIPVPQPYQQMAWRCVHCGWQSTTDDKFCRSCGKPRT